MIKVGQIWKRVGDIWTEQYINKPIVITEVDDFAIHFRSPYWDIVGHTRGIYLVENFRKYFKLLEDVCQT